MRIMFLAGLLCATLPAYGEVKVADIFADHMVLQQGKEIPVWGTAGDGEGVTVKLGGINRTTTAKHGKWMVTFPALKASTKACVLEVNNVRFSDILIGEVWLATGQSNMYYPLKACGAEGKKTAAEADWPNIRFFNRQRQLSPKGTYGGKQLKFSKSRAVYNGTWEVVSPENAGKLSGVSIYFARKLREELDVPIGILMTGVGGTPTEAFISLDALNANKRTASIVKNWPYDRELHSSVKKKSLVCFRNVLEEGKRIEFGKFPYHHPWEPGIIFDTGIKPLMPAQIRGAIWYQGESNGDNPDLHNLLWPMMVRDWRQHWGIGDFPVYYVQLPSMARPHWPAFRDGQRKFVDQVANVGMAVTIDVGMKRNVHPINKRPVGERLAFLAIKNCYEKGSVLSAGPIVRSVKANGNQVVVAFDCSEGLTTRGSGDIVGFEVASADGTYQPASAKIVKESIVLESPVSTPKQVRYGWQPFPEPALNLVNGLDQPASPFLEPIE